MKNKKSKQNFKQRYKIPPTYLKQKKRSKICKFSSYYLEYRVLIIIINYVRKTFSNKNLLYSRINPLYDFRKPAINNNILPESTLNWRIKAHNCRFLATFTMKTPIVISTDFHGLQ